MSIEKVATASKLLKQCFNPKDNESIAIITDPQCYEVGEIFYKAGKSLVKDIILLLFGGVKEHGHEPVNQVAKVMKNADIALLITNKSLSHTKARKEASISGTRIASLPGVTKDMLKDGGLKADYEKVKSLTHKVAQIFSGKEKLRVNTEAGTDFTCSIKKVKIFKDTGIYHQPGEWGNLPAGEVCFAPVPKSSEGRVVVDGSMLEKVDEPVILEIKGGEVVCVEGGEVAKKVFSVLKKHGKRAFEVGEFGLGTNDKAKLIGNVLEDEKVVGTAHIALGNNISFGGDNSVPVHIDGIFKDPTIEVDGEVIMKRGKFTFE